MSEHDYASNKQETKVIYVKWSFTAKLQKELFFYLTHEFSLVFLGARRHYMGTADSSSIPWVIRGKFESQKRIFPERFVASIIPKNFILMMIT